MSDQKKKSKILIIVIISLLAILTVGYIGYEFLIVETISVKGNTEYSSSEIAALAAVPVDTHMLLLDKEQIRENIEADPHLIVKDILCELPSTLVITVEERSAVACSDFQGNTVALSAELIVLSLNSEAESLDNLIQIRGLDIVQADLSCEIVSDIPYKVSVVQRILEEIISSDINGAITVIDVEDVNNIKLETSDGFDVNFGQGDSYTEKVYWIKTMTEKLSSEGKSGGTIDVSSGDFATYLE